MNMNTSIERSSTYNAELGDPLALTLELYHLLVHLACVSIAPELDYLTKHDNELTSKATRLAQTSTPS